MGLPSRSPQPLRHAAGRPPARGRFRAALLALPLASIAFLPACPWTAATDGEAIRVLLAREVEAFNRKDLKALSEVWSQDKGILLFDLPPPGRYQGWEQVGGQFKEFFDKVSDPRLEVQEVRVEVDGGIGYATYDWTLSGRMGDYALDDRGQATAIYRKEGGGWRLVHAHYSALAPAAATPAAPAATASPAPRPGPAASPSPRPGPAASPASGSRTPAPGASAPGASAPGASSPGAPAPAGRVPPGPVAPAPTPGATMPDPGSATPAPGATAPVPGAAARTP